MKRVLEQSVVWKFFVTTIGNDCWLTEEFASLEEARAFEKENLWKLKRACSWPIGEWSIHQVEFDREGNILSVDGKAQR